MGHFIGPSWSPWVVAGRHALARSYLLPTLPDLDWCVFPVSDDERLWNVETYLDALTDRSKAFDVRFADEVVRYENGVMTGANPWFMKLDLRVGPRDAVVRKITVHEITIDPPDAVGVIRVEYDAEVGLFGKTFTTLHVVEDFHVPATDGLIHRLESHIQSGAKVA